MNSKRRRKIALSRELVPEPRPLRVRAVAPTKALAIELLGTATLTPWASNARLHPQKQLREIAKSIQTFGFTSPVLVDEDSRIMGGHGRVEAAKLLGLAAVPCVRISDLTAAKKHALVLADNKLALNASWDEQLLGEQLRLLSDMELDFDIEVTGFSTPEIDGLISHLGPANLLDPQEDDLPIIPEGAPVSRNGDLWALGASRLICGDVLDGTTIAALMEGQLAEMIFSDPPYNLQIAGFVSGKGAANHENFAMAAGEMSSDEFTRFLQTSLGNMATHCIDGAIAFVCMDYRHLQEILIAGRHAFDELKNMIVWTKNNAGMGSFYRSQHELIFAFKKGTASHINNFELGQHGRSRSNVWAYRGNNTFKPGRLEELALHPTTKPVEMIADAIKDVSRRGGIVLDAFGGSGSTLIAAHKTGRRGFIAELDPKYVDRTIRRWEAYAHDDAILVSTGQRFEEVMGERAIEVNGIIPAERNNGKSRGGRRGPR